jgi:predicted secreted protein
MDESTGWGGEFHLSSDDTAGNLVELERVTAVDFPEDQVDEVDVTTLKAEGRRKEYISGLIDSGSFTVEMNYIPGSDTDVLCRGALTAGNTRAWKIVVPGTDGNPSRKYEGFAFVKGYKPDPLTPNDAKKATLMLRVTGAVTEGAV